VSKDERRCEYDGGIGGMELVTCSEGYRWCVERGGVDSMGGEWRTSG
jgi:hypothetical protein